MRASGHWATAMFAIFFALYDSIQASRLILRAPTVSPSIRNMYNSTACFFPPLFCSQTYTHTVTSPQRWSHPRKKEDCLLGEQREGEVCVCGGGGRGGGGVKELLVGLCWFFFSLQCPECSQCKSNVVLYAGTLTDCHMAGHCQLNNHQHQSCLPIVNLSFLIATVGQMLTEKAR